MIWHLGYNPWKQTIHSYCVSGALHSVCSLPEKEYVCGILYVLDKLAVGGFVACSGLSDEEINHGKFGL